MGRFIFPSELYFNVTINMTSIYNSGLTVLFKPIQFNCIAIYHLNCNYKNIVFD